MKKESGFEYVQAELVGFNTQISTTGSFDTF